MKATIKAGLSHRGAGVLEIIQPCPTWNNVVNMEWVAKNTQYLKEWDPVVSKEEELLAKVQKGMMLESMERRPLGVIFDSRVNANVR